MEKEKADQLKEIPLFIRSDKDFLDLTSRKSTSLTLSLSPSILAKEYFLVIDVYSASNHIHPEGHIGWWKYPIVKMEDIKVRIIKDDENGLSVLFQSQKTVDENWLNQECSCKDHEVFSIHIVLRNEENEAIEFEDIINLYKSKAALKESLQPSLALKKDSKLIENAHTRWFCWPRNTHVHIIATDIKERDAIGNFSITLYKLLKANNVPCSLYGQNFNPSLRGLIKKTYDLLFTVQETDILFLNFSIYEPYLDTILSLPGKKIMYYHNITPPRMFQIYDAEYANYCKKAYNQFKQLGCFDLYITNSKMSRQELKKELQEGSSTKDTSAPILVCPPFIGMQKWAFVEEEDIDLPQTKTILLYVGRIAPQKKIEDIIFLYNEYYKLNPDSSLLIVGKSTFKGYTNYINYLLDNEHSKIKKNIHMLRDVADTQLKTIYSKSSAFIMMSEHEGFCVPLVEAMYFKKPVFAYAQKAIEETIGQSGRLFHEKDFPMIASEINSVLSNDKEIEKIVQSQNNRLEEISKKADATILWEAFKKALFNENSF